MNIKIMSIENFKSFKYRNFTFNDRFTLIIGDNGTGKTSVLEALSVGLGGFLAGVDGVSTRNISSEEVRKEWDRVGDATVTPEKQLPCSVSCTGVIDERKFTWKRSIETINGKTTRLHAKEIIAYAGDMQKQIINEKNHNVILPLISYQSAGRLFSQKKNKWVDPFERQELSRFIGYTDCLDAESNIKLFVNWLRRMTMIKVQKQKRIGELEATIGAVEEFMKGLVGEGERVSIMYDFEEEEVIVELGDDSIPLRLMSAGYRSVIGMVADLAFRMSILNPQLKEYAVKETPGIVLIDEIDLHLHPKWQWKIVEDLKRTFPKVQFIATTHAPIVISSCEKGEIIRLYEEEGSIVDENQHSPFGWLVEDILTNIMGTFTRVPTVQKEVEEVQRLYSKKLKGELTQKEENILELITKRLYRTLPEDDPAVTLAKLNAIGDKVTEMENNEEG
ncbi:AAA family ATPase [Bacillus sp. B190/17]|uniref:AAA family ATPase n=1 Tax=Bacillus lumedeiriae TaxID=3058829 RepID=A0ABW8ICB8_9BACI